MPGKRISKFNQKLLCLDFDGEADLKSDKLEKNRQSLGKLLESMQVEHSDFKVASLQSEAEK